MTTTKIPDGEVFLRNARGTEFDIYAALTAEADALHHSHVPGLIKPADQARPGEAAFFACLQNPNQMLDVAVVQTRDEQAVVGFIQASLLVRDEDRAHVANRTARIHLIVVTEALRRRGIGRMLLNRAKRWAEAKHASSIMLDNYAFNIVAARLYEKSGFDLLKKTYVQTLD